MKKLLKLFVLVIFILFTNCKQKPRTEEKLGETNVNTEQSTITNIEDSKQQTSQNRQQTIDEFLKELQTDVSNNNISAFEEKIKVPFEYKSGGESIFYEQPSELMKSSYFKNITKAKFEKKEENNIYSILYEELGRKDFFIYFYAIKEEGKFKLTSLEMPH